MQPPYPPPWNPPPSPYAPQPYGQPGYGPPPVLGQPGYGMPPQVSFAVTQLEQRTTTWVTIMGISWLVGLMWAVGPFAWWQGAQLEREYQALGLRPADNVRLLRILGMITTILTGLAMFGLVLLLIFAAIAG